MTSTDDDDSEAELHIGSDVEESGDEVESEINSFADDDVDEAEESDVVNEEHDETGDERSEGVNEHDDVIGDDDEDYHSDVVEEAEEAYDEESGFDEEKSNDCYESNPEDKDDELDGSNAGIEEIESDDQEKTFGQDEEDPTVEDSGKECNNGAHEKRPDDQFPRGSEKVVKLRSGKKNPTYNKVVDLYLEGKCNNVKFTVKGGRSMIYDFSDTEDRRTIKRLIAKPPTGCSWSSVSSKVATTNPSPHGRKGKVSNKEKVSKKKTASKTSSGAKKPSTKPMNSSKSYAKGFTTPSDDEESVEVVLTPLKKKSPLKGKGTPITTKTNHRSNAITPPAVGKEKSSSSSAKVGTKKAHQKSSSGKKKSSTSPPKVIPKKAHQNAAKASAKKPAQKTAGNVEKGKVICSGSVGSDEDSLGFDDEGMMKLMTETQKKMKAKKPLTITVSHGFTNVQTGERVYVIVFPKPNKTFYLKPEHTRALVSMAVTKRNILNPGDDNGWPESISSIHIRDKEYGTDSTWRRTVGKGNTTDLTYFVYTVPLDDESTFQEGLTRKVQCFFDVMRKRKTDITGMMALKYARNMSPGDNGGLGLFCLTKGNGDPEKAAKVMTEEIHSHFKDGFSLQFDTPLNKYMVDFDIKQFLADRVGITSWDDLDEAGKQYCYKNYPRILLPAWDDIVEESW